MTVDSESYALAEYFLDEHTGVKESTKQALAEAIQDTIEDWLKQWQSERQEMAEADYGEYIDGKLDEWRENIVPFKGNR